MQRLCALVAAVLIAIAAPAAMAQQTIQQQMTAEEFSAAGLDKLTASELDALNRWLLQQVEEESSNAAEQAREEERRQAREDSAGRRDGGAFGSTSREPIQTHIVGQFDGFGRGQRYTLANGQVWEQTDSARLDGIRRTDPEVTVSPGALGVWYLRLDGFSTRAKVRRVN